MRLESAMISGREGLTSHGQAIAVVGDNISNVSTTAFKEGRAEFADIVSSGLEGNYGSSESESGSGSTISAVRTIFEGGIIEDTGRQLDVGIAGEGFFIVGEAADPLYSRAGNFNLNLDGILVDANGLPVLGFAPGATTLSSLDLNNVEITGSATSAINIGGNLSSISEIKDAAPAGPLTFRELAAGASFVSSVTTYDSLGAAHGITVAYTKTGLNTWTAQAYIDSGEVGGEAGVPTQLGQDVTLTFSETGVIEEANQAGAVLTAAPAYSSGAAAGNFTINFASFTQYASGDGLTGVSQDGSPTGNITGYEIQKNGDILAILDSGATQLVGTVQLANFVNKDGLDRVGSNLYKASSEAGTAVTGIPNDAGLGSLESGALERSNVDLSNEFVDLVVLQRGYQASSQSLGVANQLLRDTIALAR